MHALKHTRRLKYGTSNALGLAWRPRDQEFAEKLPHEARRRDCSSYTRHFTGLRAGRSRFGAGHSQKGRVAVLHFVRLCCHLVPHIDILIRRII